MQILSANFKEIMIRLYIFLSLFIYSIHLNTGTHILLLMASMQNVKLLTGYRHLGKYHWKY